MENENQGNKKGGLIWIILLAISVIGNIYQWRSNTTEVTEMQAKTDTLYIEKMNIDQELTSARVELEKYKGINSHLDSVVNQANEELDKNEKVIKELSKKYKNQAELNKEMKKQLANLQMLRDDYLGKIDSLLIINKQLTSEKETLTTTVKSLSKNLENTVSTASVLKSEYFKVQTLKSFKDNKAKETALARRTHIIRACFDVLENKIAKAGEKTVYFKLTEPGGKVMGNRSTGSSTFKVNGSGEEMMFTTSTTINYDNAKQNVCMQWEETADKMFPSGTYMIEVYIDGNLSGASSVTLR